MPTKKDTEDRRRIVKENKVPIISSAQSEIESLPKLAKYRKFFEDCPTLLKECKSFIQLLVSEWAGDYSNSPKLLRDNYMKENCPNLKSYKYSSIRSECVSVTMDVVNEYLPGNLEVKRRGI